MRILFFLLLLTTSCSNTDEDVKIYRWEQIKGRIEGIPPIYRAKVPKHWIILPQSDCLSDTTQPIAKYEILENGKAISIAVHNFPIRIPPESQINRWKNQFVGLSETEWALYAKSHGGFTGLYLIAQGKNCTVMAWSMQIASEHWNALTSLESPYHLEMRSDYTIKASGPPEMMRRHATDVETFANSFELVQEIPSL